MSDDIVTRLQVFSLDKTHELDRLLERSINEIEMLRKHLSSCQNDTNYWYERCTRAEASASILQNRLNKKWWGR